MTEYAVAPEGVTLAAVPSTATVPPAYAFIADIGTKATDLPSDVEKYGAAPVAAFITERLPFFVIYFISSSIHSSVDIPAEATPTPRLTPICITPSAQNTVQSKRHSAFVIIFFISLPP